MDVLFSLPTPEDLERDECALSLSGLKEEVSRLKEKYGSQASAALKEVELLVKKYETLLAEEDSKAKLERQVLGKYKNIDQATVIKAQSIIRSFIARRRFTTLASQFLSSPLAKELGKRNEIWKEILTSERAYFQNLVLLYETYFKPLKMRILQGDTKILSDKQLQKIFQNIEDIKNTAKTMWKRLEEACKNWPESAPRIGGIFLAAIPEIKSFYFPYWKGVSNSLKTLAKLKKKSHVLTEFLDKTAQDAANSGNEAALPMASLLMLPIIRIGQYELYLKELLVLTPTEHVDYPTLAKAQREITNISQEAVPVKLEAQKLQRLFTINNNIKGSNVPNLLIKDTRAFIREGPMTSVGEKRSKRSYIYLFTDALVIADLNEATDEKTFEQMLTLQGSEIRDMPDSSQAQHAFSIIRENKKTNLACATYEEKKSWVADLLGLITNNQTPGRRGITSKDSKSLLLNRTGSTEDGINKSHHERHYSSDGSPMTSNVTAPSSPSIHTPRTKKGKLTGLIQSDAFTRALEKQHATKQLEDFIDIIPPKVKIVKLSHKECIIKFDGPAEGETEHEKFTQFASAKSLSTLPFLKKKNQREGDPISDHYGLAAWHNRILAVVADGGGTAGIRSVQAAARAVDSTLSDFTESKSFLSDLRDVGMELLKSLSRAHEMIIQGKKLVWDAGTTTLLSGLLVEVEPNQLLNNANWCFVCATVGDCKAFLWSKQSGNVTEITGGNRVQVTDANDCGGRLGPYIYQGAPDLRNLQFFYSPCALDDVIILCTDGIHDNLDPELNGMIPKDLVHLLSTYQTRLSSIRPDHLNVKWEQLDPIKTDLIKTYYRISLMEKIISELDVPLNPRQVSKALTNYCVKNTRSSREFVEQGNEKVPADRHIYPGRMDHSTALVFCVGPVQLS